MKNPNSHAALWVALLIALVIIGLDTLFDAIVGSGWLGEAGFLTLALQHTLLGALAALLVYFLMRSQLAARATAEAERRAVEARMFDLVNVAPVAIIGADDALRVTSWNPAAEKLYGWTRAEALGRPTAQILAAERSPSTYEAALTAVRERGEYAAEWVHHNKAGERVIVLADTITLKNAEGEITGYVSVNRDITVSRRLEQDLAQREAQLRLIMDNVPSAISYIDKDECYVFANQGYKRLLGLDPEAMVGRRIAEIMPPEPYQTVKPRLDAALRGEPQSFENTFPRAGGGVFDGLVQFTPDHPGEARSGVFVTVTDISRMREVEEALEREHALVEARRREWELLFNNMTIGAAVFDDSGRLMTANQRFLQQHAYAAIEELVDLEAAGRRIVVMRADGARVTTADWPTARALSGQSASEELVTRSLDGVLLTARYTATPLMDENGKVAQVLLTVEDLTGLRAAEQAALARSRELEAVLDSINAGVMMADRDARVLMTNQRILAQHGYSEEDAPALAPEFGRKFLALVSNGQTIAAEDFPLVRALSGERATLEIRMEPLDGGESWIGRFTAAPVMDTEGRVDRAVLTVEDITEPRRAAEALRRSEATVREQLAEIESIYNNAPIGLCVLDTGLRFQRINQRLADINGLSRADHIGKTPRDIVPALAPAVEAIAQRILQTGEPALDVELRGTAPGAPDEEHIWIEQWSPFLNSNGQVAGFSVVAEDVTAQRQVERQLQESQELMGRALEVGRGFAFEFRAHSDEVIRSAESARILGLGAAESTRETGPNYFQRVHPEDRPRYVARMLGLTPQTDTYRTTYRILQPSGNVLYVDESARGIFDDDGTLIQVFGITQDVTERAKAEQERERLLAQVQTQWARAEALAAELQAERDALATIMEHTRTQLAFLDPEFRFVKVNTAYAQGSGVPVAALLGRGHFELFPNDENEAIFMHVRASGEPIEYSAKPFVFAGQPERGTTYWDWTLVPVKNATGVPQGFVFSLSDVTEQKRAEEVLRNARDQLTVSVAAATAELRAVVDQLQGEIAERERAEKALQESEARLRILVEQVPAILWTTDCDMLYTSQQGAGLTALGLRPNEMVGAPVTGSGQGTSEAATLVLDAHRRALAGESVSYRAQWGAATVEGYVEPLRDSDGSIVGCIGVAMDITGRIRAEQAEREREEQYRNIFASTSDAMIIVSADGRIIDVNPAACQISGYSYDEFLRLAPTEFVRENQRETIELIFEAVRSGRRLERQIIALRKDGSQFDLELRASQFQYAGAPQILVVARDVTERVRAYQLLEQRVRERTRELSALLAFSRQASATLEVRSLMQLVVDEVARLVDNSGVSLVLFEGDAPQVATNSGQFAAPAAERERQLIREPEMRALFASDPIPIVVADIHDNGPQAEAMRRLAASLFNQSEELRSLMWVPLMVKQKVIGGVTVAHVAPARYSEREAGLAQNLSSHVVVAIENARLYEQAHELAVIRERQRLARELHDSVTQSLYSLSLMAEAARRLIGSGNIERGAGYLARIGESAQQVLKEMRLLVYELRPLMLERDGLASALKQRLEAVEGRAGVETRLVVEGTGLLPENIEIELYRIAQEALNNSLKHSNATAVAVQLDTSSEVISLTVRDNGRGFRREEVQDKGGLGLISMEERAQQLGGELRIDSAPGDGAAIIVSIPTRDRTQK